MKKLNFGALLCAMMSLVTTVCAQPSVSLYGQVDLYTGAQRITGVGHTASVVNPSGMQTSFWGIRSTEALTNEMRVSAALEGFYRGDSGGMGRSDADVMFARAAWIGLESERLGSIRAGRNTNPFYIAVVATNPLLDSPTFSPALFQTFVPGRPGGPQILGDTGWSNSLVYTTPENGPIVAKAFYSFGEMPGDAGTNKAGATVAYSSAKLTAYLAYQQVKFNLVAGDLGQTLTRQRAFLAGATYDLVLARLYAQYIRVVDAAASNDARKSTWQAGASVPVGAGKFLMSFARTTADNFSFNHRETASLVYDHDLSKRTDIYLGYLWDRMSGAAVGYTAGVGMRHKF